MRIGPLYDAGFAAAETHYKPLLDAANAKIERLKERDTLREAEVVASIANNVQLRTALRETREALAEQFSWTAGGPCQQTLMGERKCRCEACKTLRAKAVLARYAELAGGKP